MPLLKPAARKSPKLHALKTGRDPCTKLDQHNGQTLIFHLLFFGNKRDFGQINTSDISPSPARLNKYPHQTPNYTERAVWKKCLACDRTNAFPLFPSPPSPKYEKIGQGGTVLTTNSDKHDLS